MAGFSWSNNWGNVMVAGLSMAGTYWAAREQQKAQEKQYEYEKRMLDEQRAWQEQAYQQRANNPMAKMAPIFMKAILEAYAPKLSKHGINLPLQDIFAALGMGSGNTLQASMTGGSGGAGNSSPFNSGGSPGADSVSPEMRARIEALKAGRASGVPVGQGLGIGGGAGFKEGGRVKYRADLEGPNGVQTFLGGGGGGVGFDTLDYEKMLTEGRMGINSMGGYRSSSPYANMSASDFEQATRNSSQADGSYGRYFPDEESKFIASLMGDSLNRWDTTYAVDPKNWIPDEVRGAAWWRAGLDSDPLGSPAWFSDGLEGFMGNMKEELLNQGLGVFDKFVPFAGTGLQLAGNAIDKNAANYEWMWNYKNMENAPQHVQDDFNRAFMENLFRGEANSSKQGGGYGYSTPSYGAMPFLSANKD